MCTAYNNDDFLFTCSVSLLRWFVFSWLLFQALFPVSFCDKLKLMLIAPLLLALSLFFFATCRSSRPLSSGFFTTVRSGCFITSESFFFFYSRAGCCCRCCCYYYLGSLLVLRRWSSCQPVPPMKVFLNNAPYQIGGVLNGLRQSGWAIISLNEMQLHA